MASELERLRARNAELEKRFDDMQRGNLLNTYLTIDGQHKSFNEQLTIGVILDENNKQKVVGRIDLFASKGI